MSKPSDGGPAFPSGRSEEHGWEDVLPYYKGMTLRAYLAGQAMQGLMVGYHDHPNDIKTCAKVAVESADALIAELNKEEAP